MTRDLRNRRSNCVRSRRGAAAMALVAGEMPGARGKRPPPLFDAAATGRLARVAERNPARRSARPSAPSKYTGVSSADQYNVHVLSGCVVSRALWIGGPSSNGENLIQPCHLPVPSRASPPQAQARYTRPSPAKSSVRYSSNTSTMVRPAVLRARLGRRGRYDFFCRPRAAYP